MKNCIITIILFCVTALSAGAQDVYNEIRNNAIAAATAPLNNETVKHINQFKVDALDYMLIKMREQMPDSTTTFLDKQAYAMNNFINYYIRTVLAATDLPPARQVQFMQLFMDASISNPLFNDPDGELVHAYYADGNSIIRFSLDTDWRRAAAAVFTELKKK